MMARCQPARRENQWTVSHRMSGSPTYKSWTAMIRRCHVSHDKDFPRYGGRGITVCKEWERFENFLADMGKRPAGTTLERLDTDGSYNKLNCRWATVLEQNRNRTCSINVTLNGETKPLKVWCDEIGVNYFTAHNRITRFGWSPDRIFGPVRKNRPFRSDRLSADEIGAIRNLLASGVSQREIAAQYRVSQSTISHIKLGLSRYNKEAA